MSVTTSFHQVFTIDLKSWKGELFTEFECLSRDVGFSLLYDFSKKVLVAMIQYLNLLLLETIVDLFVNHVTFL